MLIYVHRITEEFNRLRDYAANVRSKFHTETAQPDNLLLDVNSMRVLYEHLNEMLPEGVRNKCEAERHLGFMQYWLKKNNLSSCTRDIEDLCEHDIPALENAFHAWCRSPAHYDAELAKAISDLLAHGQLDSAIRKAFLVLKERLCKHLESPLDLDGAELVNRIFGTSSSIASLSASERQAFRDLLAGLYGIFRNRFAHHNESPSWGEADAIISMINHVLQELGRIK